MNQKDHLFKIPKIDSFLIVALLASLIFCIQGITWGRVESWNMDDVAFSFFHGLKSIFQSPGWFLKPPFHGYFNFFLSYLPLKLIEKLFNLSPNSLSSGEFILLWSRFLTIILFLGSIVLVFQITKRFFGDFSARMITLLFASSAGFISYTHFLTADIPVTFWMLLAFYFSQSIYLNGKIFDYILAGFFTGIATATKYNALAMGMTIVVAHVLSLNNVDVRKIIFSKNLFFGLFMICVGFLCGNPFAFLDRHKFISDFWYNYLTTPIYEGISTGNSYWKFFLYFQELIGLPSLIIFAIAILSSLYLTLIVKEKNRDIKPILLLLSVCLLYYWKFGSFPRLEVRFVLPIVPFWLIMSAPFWNKLKANQLLVLGILIIIITYNTICSLYVGKRFLEDPRMSAQVWVQKNIPELSSIESSAYTPTWNALPKVKLKDERFPWISGRSQLFQEAFKNNPSLLKLVKVHENQKENLKWYSADSLLKRNPKYIAIDSLYYKRFLENQNEVRLYPEMHQFFKNLLDEKDYKIVFEQESNKFPSWIYPQNIDVLNNKIIIFAQKDVRK